MVLKKSFKGICETALLFIHYYDVRFTDLWFWGKQSIKSLRLTWKDDEFNGSVKT